MDNTKEPTTNELVELAKSGDQDALEAIISRHRAEVYNAAKFILNNEQDAEDVTQEVFIKLFKNIHNLKNTDSFSSWLRIITVNECKMLFRKNKNAAIPYDEDEKLEALLRKCNSENINDIPHQKLDHIENNRLLYSIIENLPEKYSQLLIMYFYAEMSYNEIADSLGINVGTVKSRLFTAKNKLRKEIIAYEKKSGTNLHTNNILNNLSKVIRQLLSQSATFEKSVTSAVPTAVNSMSTGVSAAFSTTISNSSATKISVAAAAASIAVCVSVTSSNFSPISLPPDNEQSSSVAEAAEPESSDKTDIQTSDNSIITNNEPSIVYVYRDSEPSIIYRDRDPSIVYRDGETSIVYRDGNTSVVYRDREVVREAEPSIVYITETAESKPRRYDKYIDIYSDDQSMRFRIYTENNEAMLTNYFGYPEISDFPSDIVLPSYIEYEGNRIPVTRIMYNFLSTTANSHIKSVQLPEMLEYIPNGCFEDTDIETVTGGKNITRIGDRAFGGCKIKELNMRELFPNVIEIGDLAFRDCPIKKLVLPDGIMRLDPYAFSGVELDELSAITDIDFSIPPANTVHLIIQGDVINNAHYNSWSDSLIANIPELYVELENKNAVFDDTTIPNGMVINGLSHIIIGTFAENFHIPDGMKKLRTNEFEIFVDDDDNDYYGKIKNLYISDTVTEIEPDAFTTVRHIIKNILLPKNSKDTKTTDKLKKSILKSSQFIFDHEDENYVYFTDPEAIFPDEGYIPPEEVPEEDLTDEEVIIDDPVYDDDNIIYEIDDEGNIYEVIDVTD